MTAIWNKYRKQLLLLLYFLFQGCCSYSADFSLLLIDLENYWRNGLRPLFLGTEYALTAQGGILLTEGDTDYCILRQGYFVLHNEITDEIILTRNGSFLFNGRGYLTNHDGYYVVSSASDVQNKAIQYITYDMWTDGDSHIFLIVMPDVNGILSISSEYIIPSKVEPVSDIKILRECVEEMPISLDMLLSVAIAALNNGEKPIDTDIPQLMQLIKKRYREIEALSRADQDYLQTLQCLINNLEALLASANRP